MRLIALLLALVMVAVPIAAYAYDLPVDGGSISLAAQEGMSRYVDPELGFSFLYPDTWELLSRTQSGGTLTIIFRNPVAEFGMHSVAVLETEEFAGSLEDLLGVLKKGMAKEPNGVLEPMQEPVLVAGVSAQIYRAKFDLADGRTVYIGGEWEGLQLLHWGQPGGSAGQQRSVSRHAGQSDAAVGVFDARSVRRTTASKYALYQTR